MAKAAQLDSLGGFAPVLLPVPKGPYLVYGVYKYTYLYIHISRKYICIYIYTGPVYVYVYMYIGHIHIYTYIHIYIYIGYVYIHIYLVYMYIDIGYIWYHIYIYTHIWYISIYTHWVYSGYTRIPDSRSLFLAVLWGLVWRGSGFGLVLGPTRRRPY